MEIENIKEQFIKHFTEKEWINYNTVIKFWNWVKPYLSSEKQKAIKFTEWVEKTYSLVVCGKRSAWVNANEHEIYTHGSSEYNTLLIEKYGKTTAELYDIFDNLNIKK